MRAAPLRARRRHQMVAADPRGERRAHVLTHGAARKGKVDLASVSHVKVGRAPCAALVSHV
jgi:hypothetical protein